MEDLLSTGDGSLGLNIVAQPVAATKQQPIRKKRKNNKYERRRRRAQQARERKGQQQSTEDSSQKHEEESGKVILKGSEAPESSQSSQHDSSGRGDTTKAVEPPAVEKKKEEDRSSLSRPTAKSTSDGESTDEAQYDASESEESPTENNKDNSNNHHLPADQAERAQYLAEFHARPMELDRRAGATARQLRSHESKHLFVDQESWEVLKLHPRLVATVTDHMNLQQPTVVQSRAIPAFFRQQQEHNLLIQSETGSGKTLAYMLPILQSLATAAGDKNATSTTSQPLQKMDRRQLGTRCIILCPIRELAVQTLHVAEQLCGNSCNWIVPGCLFGQESRKSEKARLRKGLGVIIGTPGRVLDHLTRTECLLMALKGQLQWLVLDEADRLLDMGLGAQIQQIVQRLRANQPGSGHDGITWRSVLVSATVPQQVEELARETLLGGNGTWIRIHGGGKNESKHHDMVAAAEVASGSSKTHKEDKDNDDHADEDNSNHNKSATTTTTELAESTPRQLIQYYMNVSAKFRLAALIAFLAQRVERNERTVVFMATCASVDFYHAIFKAAGCIIGDKQNDADQKDGAGDGIFGRDCQVFKLHGNVPHAERQQVLKRFAKKKMKNNTTEHEGDNKSKNAAILFATDVAARGLNTDIDWTVQYDPPAEVSDYVHRAGRVARAGQAGRSLLFLLPSENLFLDVLKQRGVHKMNALSLASILNSAAGICKTLTEEGVARSGGGLGGGGGPSKLSASRAGEAFCAGIQHRLEECIAQDDKRAKAERKAKVASQKRKRTGEKPQDAVGELLDLASAAFMSHIRAYPTREKPVRHIFSAKSLHLGHVARSFALKEPPKQLVSKKKRRVVADNTKEDTMSPHKYHDAMAFDFEQHEGSGTGEQQGRKNHHYGSSSASSSKKRLMLEKAAQMQKNGMDYF